MARTAVAVSGTDAVIERTKRIQVGAAAAFRIGGGGLARPRAELIAESLRDSIAGRSREVERLLQIGRSRPLESGDSHGWVSD
jgi:hypothetical protein